MLLAGPIFHTSTQYIDFVDFLHFTGFVCHLFCSFLVGIELPLCVAVTLSQNAVSFFLGRQVEYKIVCFISCFMSQ